MIVARPGSNSVTVSISAGDRGCGELKMRAFASPAYFPAQPPYRPDEDVARVYAQPVRLEALFHATR
jgi:hypothetical protein